MPIKPHIIACISAMAVASVSSNVALAALSQSNHDALTSNAKTALLLKPGKSDQKYCRVVRNSLYGHFRKKCRTAAEWEEWISRTAPKIEKQWQIAGATQPKKGGKNLQRYLALPVYIGYY
ncbi:hypothetical protein [Pseudoteredinibacter isoporae]|uniref:Uncharacterized protein n=1 Tax=Pseudoteredinibacter isoporae TaxID=570281 RepID=A0A7X0JQR9_9GAMM|nr:hypothetical protein [Pseudoteredinibacter isoporae]MBB6520520.1 hypothetical protein [Pseudoteredinibacter isoporae]NHO86087.1 hypothetical protein [Pseudoteredinibacter isoporae]NIB25462.1 hypothetical protein [Pseudoteredinibacter isoporae]